MDQSEKLLIGLNIFYV